MSNKNSMDRAFGVTREDRDLADKSAELMSTPLFGDYEVEVMKASHKDANEDREGKPIPACLSLFCRVVLEKGYDPRPMNLQFMNWNPDTERAFRVKMGHLFRALGTTSLKEMKGVHMRVTVKRKDVVNPRFFHSYLALRTEPISK